MLLKEFRDTSQSFADLLPYAAMISPTVLLNKDGSLSCAWRFWGPDTESSSEEELSALSESFARALGTLGTGWAVHIDAMRVPSRGYPETAGFPNAVCALIDAEREAHFKAEGRHFETIQTITLTYMPPPERSEKAASMLLTGERVQKDYATAAFESFHKNAQAFIERLGAFKTEQLSGGALLSHLRAAITGKRLPVRVPDPAMYLDAYLSDEFTAGFEPQIGEQHIRVLTVMDYPSATEAAMLEAVMDFPGRIRFNTRFIPLDAIDAQSEIEKVRRNWYLRRLGMGGMLAQAANLPATWQNTDAVNMSLDADAAVTECQAGVRFGYVTHTIVVYGDSKEEADESAQLIKKSLENAGFPTVFERVNAVEAYLGSLPASTYPNIRRPLMHALNVADCAPLSTLWAGPEKHPSALYKDNAPLFVADATGSTPFRFYHHVSDVGHTMILGPTGSGKSTLLSLMAAQHLRYEGAQVFMFDKGYSAWTLAKALGEQAAHNDLLNGPTALAPFARLDSEADKVWAADWIETLCVLNGLPVDAERRQAIAAAIRTLSEQPADKRSITELTVLVQDNALRDALKDYATGGAVGGLFDSPQLRFDRNIFTVFELETIMGTSPRFVVPALQVLFREVETALDGSPTLIVLDEAWLMLDNELFVEKIKEWLKVLRKRNASVIFATQSLADVVNSKIAPALLESCPTRIFLPNPKAREPQVKAAYSSFGLSDAQINLLSRLQQKRDYYYVSELGKRAFSLALGPIALAFAGASDEESRRSIRDLIELHGSDWVEHWLRQRGVSEEWIELLKEGEK